MSQLHKCFIDRNGDRISLTTYMSEVGQKRVRIMTARGSFSIQTCGNLPNTHNECICKPVEIHKEIAEYVSSCGTDRQKRVWKYNQ